MDDEFWSDDIDDSSDLGDWIVGFGQSPECRSYAEAMNKGQYTFSNCGSSNTVIQTAGGLNFSYPSQIPPALVRYEYPNEQLATCCGSCSLDIPQVRLYYFPDESTECYRNQTSNVTSRPSHSLVANGSIAVISGHTFTSPSLYLQLMGTATITDQCTTVGPMLINPIITLAPGELSTWKPDPHQSFDDPDNFTVGEIWQDPSGTPDYDIAAGIAPLEIQDLACPTWGLGESTSAGTVVTTIGPPWLPLIVPPMNIFSLNPTWAAMCTGIFSDSFGLTTFALFDPPIALTPASLLLPTPPARPTPAPSPADPTLVSEQAKPSTEAAKPASLLKDPAAPAKTGDPGKNTPTQSPDIASADPAGSANLPENSAASTKNEGDPPSDPKLPVVLLPKPVEDPQTQAQGLGAIIYNAFGKGGPKPDGLSTILLPPQSVLAVGTQTFTANPTGFEVNGAAIAPGGTAQTVDGTTISLDKLGVLAIGSSTVFLTTNPSSTPVLAVAGQTFAPNPSAFSVAGTIVSAGGPAITVDGTAISLGQSGALAIGSTTISLATPSTKAFTVAGQTFTPNPSAFSIAGTTLSADGPAAIIDGTIISLGQHGALKIGSSTINLPTPSDTFPSKVYTVAGQAFAPNPSAFLVAGTTISAGGPAATFDGTIISLESSGTLVVGSSTIPLLPLTTFTSNVDIDGFDVIAHSSFAVVDGVTVSAAATGVTVSGKVVSLEAGGATLNIGTGHFALPTPAAAGNDSVNVQAFMGGQKKGLEVSLSFLIWGVCGTSIMLSTWALIL